VEKLLDTAFNKKDLNAAAGMLTDEYIQHNPGVETGKAGFLKSIPGFYKMYPDMKWELKHIYTDGDFVIVHSLYMFTKKGSGTAAVDIFRIKDGKADEHWDVLQQVPDKSANKNTMF
jgi:predicted SnoaL-like aldol condensation-catalyzing enzyme